MITLRTVRELRAWRAACPLRVGFVPTMGALHAGHAALLRAARSRCDQLVVSVFVNPTQFAPGEDFAVYPRDPEGDAQVCAAEGADVLWFGETQELYPPGFAARVELPGMARTLCGPARPGHFAGVALIVLKLLNLVRPHLACFGLKDYQQWVIVRQLVRDLDLDCEIFGHPTVREPSGLALSSRNRRLSPAGLAAAPVLYRALCAARAAYEAGERRPARLVQCAAREILAVQAVQLEYLELVDAEHLALLDLAELPLVEPPLAPHPSALLAVAARLEGVRLIDNLLLARPPAES